VAHRIVMPSLGMYTAEGKLIRWLRSTGTRVEAGEPIVEIETEKAVHEIEAPAAGFVHEVAQPEDKLLVEALIGYILAEGEPAPAKGEAAPRRTPTEAPGEAALRTSPADSKIRATPIAKRLASDHKIDLALVTGSGPGGRIVEADVRAAIAAASTPAPGLIVRERIPITGLRRIITERLRYSFEQAIPLTLTREARTDHLEAARYRLAEKGVAVSYDSLFIKALATALRQDPRLNASVQGDCVCVYDNVNVGFAVAVSEGLVVPVVRHADTQSLAVIERSVRRLSEAARTGRLSPDEVLTGTITITNLGAYGVDAFTPVLNPPQAAILGIGRIQKRPVVDEGSVALGSTCVLSLTFDHRVCDGVPAAQLLASVVASVSDERQLLSWAQD
jgi:pyruvate dehydrogenase E2 component (dihydrolipoyllysine-residue acetyltransferase)